MGFAVSFQSGSFRKSEPNGLSIFLRLSTWEVVELKIALSTIFGLVAALTGADLSLTASSWALSPALAQGSSSILAEKARLAFSRMLKRLKFYKKKDVRWDEIASSLALQIRAGKTLVDAIKGVSREGQSQGHKMLERGYRLYESGVPVFEALEMASGGDSELAMIAGVIEIGSVSGGNMAALLWHVFEVLRKRRAFQGEVSAKLSETRITAMILSVMPWIIGIFTLRNNPSMFYMFLGSYQGKTLFAVAVGLWAVGNILILVFMQSLAPRTNRFGAAYRERQDGKRGHLRS